MMKRVMVLIPFNLADTKCKCGDVLEVTEEQLANIRAINVNMVLVLQDEEKKKKTTKK